MISSISLALLGGFLMVVNRVFFSRLAKSKGPIKASYYNHLVGLIFLAILILPLGIAYQYDLMTINPLYLLGGVVGANFVALFGHVINKIGAAQATILVISGKMLSSAMIEVWEGTTHRPLLTFLGCALIIIGNIYNFKFNKSL